MDEEWIVLFFSCTYFPLDEDECVSNPCQHHGKCHVDGMSYLCNCSRAWEGANCESK